MAKTVSVWRFLVLAFCPALLAAQSAPNSGGWGALVELGGVQTDGGPTRSAGAPSYGVTSTSAYSFAAHDFHPISSEVTYAFTPNPGNLSLYRTNAAGDVWLLAPIHLPTGALMTSFEFLFCDTSATKAFFSFLVINDKSGPSFSQPSLVSSTNPEAPGCINRSFTPVAPVEVDNDLNAYSLEVNLGGNPSVGDNTIVLSQARIYYRLQVSPAPATATFPVDVPTTHPFFRFIEALAAAGITGGCAPQAYCPDGPITRGQMAVFLSVALGLHFPN
jgi:hypothetical protein